MRKFLTIIFLCTLAAPALKAQTWAVYLSGNEYYPLNSTNKTYYPILWYTSKDDRGVLLGGFGAGVSYEKQYKPTFSLKYQVNLQRSVFYDEPYFATDENGFIFGALIGINTHYNATTLCIPRYHMGKWSVGLGLGSRITAYAQVDYGEALVNGEKEDLLLKSKALAPFVLTLPLEVSFQPWLHWVVNCRAELGVTPASRLSAYDSERGLSAVLEVGYRFVKVLGE
ncbi:MAG: hypothetical protein SH848_17775 [Saprospiraceae bacterium]|nr:hypothetical protein [Saprospiraceae bacterium]MDZ4705781.1 hypothetical protein [Saprospiraceae bacterium]